MIGKILHIGKNRAQEGTDKQVWFVQNTDGGFGEESQPQVKFCDLYPYVSLQTVYEQEYMNVIMNMSINIST